MKLTKDMYTLFKAALYRINLLYFNLRRARQLCPMNAAKVLEKCATFPCIFSVQRTNMLAQNG